MTQKEAKLQAKAEELGESQRQESYEERIDRMEAEAEERLNDVQDDRSERG